jgi:Holliday junction resolvasome RuvABC endonuclease subunit
MALAHNCAPGRPPVVVSESFKGTREVRAAATMDWLLEWFDAIQVCHHADAVVYERPFARGRDATRSLWGLAGIIEAAATRAGMAVLDVENQTLKKFATGNRKASKEQMIEAAQLMGYTGNNEHEADAWCLLQYATDRVQWESKN